MKQYKTNSLRLWVIAIVAISLGFFSCQKESPLGPQSTNKNIQSADELVFVTSIDTSFRKPFILTQLISAATGGLVTAGNIFSGFSYLKFSPGDLPTDTVITFNWNHTQGTADLYPHGIVFNSPVEFTLSYKKANLGRGVDEDSLKIAYFNEDNGLWEIQETQVNKLFKTASTQLSHFSRYALVHGKSSR